MTVLSAVESILIFTIYCRLLNLPQIYVFYSQVACILASEIYLKIIVEQKVCIEGPILFLDRIVNKFLLHNYCWVMSTYV